MVKIQKINWTKKAFRDYLYALEYWSNRNQNTIYSEKLISLIQFKIRLLQDFPNAGKLTSKANYRYILISDYLLIYKIKKTEITIMRFWHGKQNPTKTVYFK